MHLRREWELFYLKKKRPIVKYWVLKVSGCRPKERQVILLAVDKGRLYLKIRPEPQSLKQEKKLTHPLQYKVLTKLMGLEYTIELKKGVTNWVADALSRAPENN